MMDDIKTTGERWVSENMITKTSIKGYTKYALTRGNDYLYIPPHELLKPYISNYTITFPTQNTMPDNYTIMPSASSTLVFSIDNNSKIMGALRGVNTKPGIVGSHANKCLFLLLIEFQPYGLHQFINVNQLELTNLNFMFDVVDIKLHRKICDVIECTNSIYDLVSELNLIFLSYIDKLELNKQLVFSVESIIKSRGLVTNKELTNSVYYSEKQLNRIFQECIGMNIKTFSRIVRINYAIRLFYTPKIRLTQVAQLCGYYDQSHFIHDFKSICGITPQEYLKNMSIYYNENFKL